MSNKSEAPKRYVCVDDVNGIVDKLDELGMIPEVIAEVEELVNELTTITIEQEYEYYKPKKMEPIDPTSCENNIVVIVEKINEIVEWIRG